MRIGKLGLILVLAILVSALPFSANAAKENYARGAKCQVQNNNGQAIDVSMGLPVELVTDGDYSVAVAGAQWLWTLYMDLGREIDNIGEITPSFDPAGVNIPTNYMIMVAGEDKQWTTVADITDNTQGGRIEHKFDPMKVRYIMIRDMKDYTNIKQMAITEVEVYEGTASVAMKTKLHSPADGKEGVNLDENITVTFSKPLAKEYMYVIRMTDGHGEVSCKRTLAEDGKSIVLDPVYSLKEYGSYNVWAGSKIIGSFTTAGVDFAKTATARIVSANGFIYDNASNNAQAAKAIDGDEHSTAIMDDVAEYDFIFTLELEMAEVREISCVDILFGTIPNIFYIKVSEDGVNWTKIGKYFPKGEKHQVIEFPTEKAKFVRIEQAEHPMMGVNEVKIFNLKDKAPVREIVEEPQGELAICSVSTNEYMENRDNAIYPAFVDNMPYEAWTEEGMTEYYPIRVTGGSKPYKFEMLEGKLPEGLSMDSEGRIAGIAKKAETTEFKIRVTDAAGAVAEKQLSMTAEDYRSKWFSDAKFGMMIQWGAFALPWKASTHEEIAKFEKQTTFDADKWAQQLYDMGGRVMNFTAMAGDGVRMWPSKAPTVQEMKTKRNFVKELIDACHKRDMKFTAYVACHYGWNPALAESDLETGAITPMTHNMVRELLEMGVDGFWFDIGNMEGFHDFETMIPIIRTLNPYATIQANSGRGEVTKYPYVDIQLFECPDGTMAGDPLLKGFSTPKRRIMATEMTGLLTDQWGNVTEDVADTAKETSDMIENIKANWDMGVTYMLVAPQSPTGDLIHPRIKGAVNEIAKFVTENRDTYVSRYKKPEIPETDSELKTWINPANVEITMTREHVMTGMSIRVGEKPVILEQIGRYATGKDGDLHQVSIVKQTYQYSYPVLSQTMDFSGKPEADGFVYASLTEPVVLEPLTTYYISCEEDGSTNFAKLDTAMPSRDMIVTDLIRTDRTCTMYYEGVGYGGEGQVLNMKYKTAANASITRPNLAVMANLQLQDNEGNVAIPSMFTAYAANAVDNRPETAAAAGHHWAWTLWGDLGAVYDNIGEIQLEMPATTYATEFEIQVSEDNVNWTVATKVSENRKLSHEFKYDALSARYFRIRALKPDGEGQEGAQMWISELRIYENE